MKTIDPFAELTTAEKLESDILAQISMTVLEKRLSLGMTQQEFADYLHVSQTMVYRWESCSYNFTIKSLSELYSKLGLTFSLQTSIA